MTKIAIDNVEVTAEFDIHREGSVLRGTVEVAVTEFRTELAVTSSAPEDAVQRVLRLAKRGCFAEQLVRDSIPLRSVLVLNGRRLTLDGLE